jgi:hypothetical protein
MEDVANKESGFISDNDDEDEEEEDDNDIGNEPRQG